MVLGIFKIAFRLRVRYVFMCLSLEVLNVFNTLILKQIFSRTKSFFKKLENTLLVESTRTEKAAFPYKTALSEANIKTNRMVSIKWTDHKGWSFASDYFSFSKILLQFNNLVQRVDLMHQPPKCPYSYFSKALVFYLRVLIPCEYLLWSF